MSQVSIANRALAYIGANKITSLSEGTQEANAISNVYGDSLRSILSEAPWVFALKRSLLNKVQLTPSWGRGNYFAKVFGEQSNEISEETAENIIEAMQSMAAVKTGALIVIEQKVQLGEYEQTGLPIDANVTSQLIINIFEKNTPLHDGAMIIRQNRILSATCYLPLSDNSEISKDLGTRHRAALGLSEVSDAKIFIVSEETGAMSMAYGGQIYRKITPEFIRKELLGTAQEHKSKVQVVKEKIMRDKTKKKEG